MTPSRDRGGGLGDSFRPLPEGRQSTRRRDSPKRAQDWTIQPSTSVKQVAHRPAVGLAVNAHVARLDGHIFRSSPVLHSGLAPIGLPSPASPGPACIVGVPFFRRHLRFRCLRRRGTADDLIERKTALLSSFLRPFRACFGSAAVFLLIHFSASLMIDLNSSMLNSFKSDAVGISHRFL